MVILGDCRNVLARSLAVRQDTAGLGWGALLLPQMLLAPLANLPESSTPPPPASFVCSEPPQDPEACRWRRSCTCNEPQGQALRFSCTGEFSDQRPKGLASFRVQAKVTACDGKQNKPKVRLPSELLQVLQNLQAQYRPLG